jgi:hypothetical protein
LGDHRGDQSKQHQCANEKNANEQKDDRSFKRRLPDILEAMTNVAKFDQNVGNAEEAEAEGVGGEGIDDRTQKTQQ